MLENLGTTLENALGASTLLAVAVSYAGGVLASFTPCTYPLIPLTVSYIGARRDTGRAAGFFLSVAYVLGTSVIYTALGSIAGLTGSLFGTFQTNPWVNIAAANVFILMGLAMLGVFTIPLPSFVHTQLFSPARSGIAGAFLLGLASGLIMSPCTAPILAVLLGYVATRQNVLFGTILLFVFSFGMGTILIILGTFTGLVKSIPRSGPWMERIQKVFGLVFIGMGEYALVQAGMFLV